LWLSVGVHATELFDEEEVERGRRYHRPVYAALAARTALGLAVLTVLAFTPAGDALHRLVAGLPWWLEAPLFAGLALLVSTLVRLPVSWWSGYRHEHRWGLSTQTGSAWLGDKAKALAVSVVLMGGALTALVGLARVLPGAWPVVAAAAAAALVLVLVFVAPVVLEPLFNRFEPLADEELRSRLLGLAERAATPVREVLVADASRRTRKANAYVSGIGASRRVVLFDTLLERSSQAEIEVVVAHELAHRRERHTAKLAALGMGGAALGVALLWLTLGDRVADPRTIPHVLLVFALLQLAVLAPGTALMRRWERVCDRFALELTRDPAAFESVFRTLTDANVADLDPPRLVRLLIQTHPSVPDRIAVARRFATVRG
jgi:STE24 endopeptidase